MIPLWQAQAMLTAKGWQHRCFPTSRWPLWLIVDSQSLHIPIINGRVLVASLQVTPS